MDGQPVEPHGFVVSSGRLRNEEAPVRPLPQELTKMTHTVRILAHAKVNLSLEVLGVRDDGFHEIRSLMVPLVLADRLTLSMGGRQTAIRVPANPALESDDNLALRAARTFREHFGLPGVTILLEKRIPIAAGLGGGSSDAAAVLRGLATLRGVPAAALHPLAESLGSDVPFFLGEKPVWVAGRGESLSAASSLPPLWLLLVKPAFGISAADAYRAWDKGQTTSPTDAGALRKGWNAARRASAVGKLLTNHLQPGCLLLRPELGDLLRRLGKLGATGVLMSGSGSTCVAIFADSASLRNAAQRFKPAEGEAIFLSRTLSRATAAARGQTVRVSN
jgi:4-diphosphocytidyl-2-C-methyl-D-erythritol kinase